MNTSKAEPNIFVIFGGTGDLSERKLLPAVGRLTAAGNFGDNTHILGVARSREYDDASFAEFARTALAKGGLKPEQIEYLCSSRLHYQSIGEGTKEDFRNLAKRLNDLEDENELPGNRAFYLALPPRAFEKTVAGLGETGLSKSKGWTRMVFEKPFGHDLESSLELNELVHRYFKERQIYRIDHYLGKEMVQNLLVFRFANALFESLWNRERIYSVQITVGESLGVGSRGGYYERSGALRDMVQNHLTQLLTLIAMEVPAAYEADSIRYEKIKVLKSIEPIDPSNVIFGQYTTGSFNGEVVPGYRDEKGIAPGSKTETFAAMKLFINNWRWKGVPFFLRTGKRLPRRLTQIALRFHQSPVCLFDKLGGKCNEDANVLLITLQPDEGFTLKLDVKRPGQEPFALQQIPLEFKYSSTFEYLPEAYETLLLDVLEGDQTLFVHGDEVEHAWRLYQPILDSPPTTYDYPAGTWGPWETGRLGMVKSDLE